MKTILLSMALFLFATIPNFSSGTSYSGPPDAGSIQQLIRDLGSEVYTAYEIAFDRLRETPAAGTIPVAARCRNDQDPETQRRIDILLKHFTRIGFRKRIRDVLECQNDTPLDLLAELMLAYREDVDQGEWKLVIDAVAAISGKASDQAGFKINLLDPKTDYLKYPQMCGDSFSFPRIFPSCRMVARSFVLQFWH